MPIGFFNKYSTTLIVLGFIFFSILLRLAAFTGLIGATDDLGYSHYAQLVNSGKYMLEHHHYAIRFGVFIPVAFIYKLFGISEMTTVLYPLLCSSISVGLLALFATKLFDVRTGIITGILYSTFPVSIRYSTILVPEPIAELFIVSSFLFMLLAYKHRLMRYSFLGGLTIGLGYLTKEPVVFVGLSLIIILLIKKQWKLIFTFAGGCITIVTVEHLYYLITVHDILYRFHSMGVHELSPMAVTANLNLSWRLLKQYPKMMLFPNINFGLHSLFSITMAALVVKNLGFKNFCMWSLMLCALIPLLYLNFGSSSLNRYFALPAAPRYISMVYLPIFVLASAMLSTFIIRCQEFKTPMLILLVSVAFFGTFCALKTAGTGYQTSNVNALKAIKVKLIENNIKTVKMGPELKREKEILYIISPETKCNSLLDKNGDLVIESDALGLPFVRYLR